MQTNLNISTVNFFAETHTYCTQEGVILKGITGILSRNLFKNKYANIPKHILENAANRGSYVHEQLQSMDMFGSADDIQEVSNYNLIKEVNKITPLSNEYLISDNYRYATQIDMVDENLNLYDFKTTSKLDVDYLSWQLSICAYLFELQNPHLKAGRLFGLWLREDIAKLVEVERKSTEDIERLLDCDYNKREFINTSLPAVKPESEELVRLLDIENYLIELDRFVKEAKIEKENILSQIEVNMIEQNQKSFETDKMKVTRVLPTTKVGLDSKKLKEEMPEVYAKYEKVSEVKGSIRITIKNK